MLAAKGIPLRVLVFPVLKPSQRRNREELNSRAQALEMLHSLGIPHEDLWTPLSAALEQGEDLSEGRKDTWHPNDRAARLIADYLSQRKFLGT